MLLPGKVARVLPAEASKPPNRKMSRMRKELVGTERSELLKSQVYKGSALEGRCWVDS